MTLATTEEIFWLAAVISLTGLLWVPYIVQLIFQLGPFKALWDPTGAHPHDADWALRAKRAHYNAVENLAVFAPLAILIPTLNLDNELTAQAAMIYFFARAAHYVIYIMALPIIRTLAFVLGFACQAMLALRLFGFI